MRLVTGMTVVLAIALTAWGQAIENAEAPATKPAAKAASRPASRPAAKPRPPAPVAAKPASLDPALEKYARGDYAGAAALLEGAYKRGGTSIQHRLILARAYVHVGRGDEALAVLKSVHADDKENGEANALTGQLLLERGKAPDALEFLKTAHRLKKEVATASMLGRCYYATGQVAKAKPLLEEAVAADVRNPDNSLILGKICLARGLGSLAEKHLLAAQEAGLEGPELHLLLVRAYLMQHKYVGPIVVRRLPGQPRAGEVLEGMMVLGPVPGVPGQYRLCQKLCGLYEGYQVLKGEPANADGRYALARGWLAAGEADEAARRLAELAAVEPESRRTLELKAKLLIGRKDFAGVRALLTAPAAGRAFGADGLAQVWYRAAMALRAQGQREEALGMFAQAETLQPTSGQVLRAVAGLHLAMGKRDDARRYYGRMVELFPDAADIDELRNTLKSLGGVVPEEAKDDTTAQEQPETKPAAAAPVVPVEPAVIGRPEVKADSGDEAQEEKGGAE